jgi:LacI family gluconate utilization system Gnt-I transcriptional repressor
MGFASVLREAGVSDELIVREGTAPVSHDHGARTISTLLERAPDVEAVFAVSDISAFGALMECHRRGIKVPDQLSLMGFGDFDIARQCVPAMTTIRVDAVGIGVKTGELLLNLFEKSDTEEISTAASSLIDVGFKLIERQTVARRKV